MKEQLYTIPVNEAIDKNEECLFCTLNKKVEEDIDWFIQKFDYRFKDEPWKNSKDALQRTILKVSSENVEE